MSILSSKGPDILLKYRCISAGDDITGASGSLKYPPGLGFILATNIKLDGYVTVNFAREIVTSRSSNGCRITSKTPRLNSGSSSKNKTPLWANEISPGCGYCPPPTRATSEIVWCGLLKGREVITPPFSIVRPATL